MPGLPLIKKVESVERFREILANNPGLVIVKFGATWCGPCKKIDPDVNDIFSKMPATVQCVMLDIDESIEIYSFLKSKRRVNGVPVLLCYQKGNLNYIPDETVVGANKDQLMSFFERCFALLKK
jgi:thiol-disulfide isomerase/thioredoxin